MLIEAAQDKIDLEQVDKITSKYPELSTRELLRELPMLPSVLTQQNEQNQFLSFNSILSSLKSLPQSMLNLIPMTLTLVQLIMVFPSTAASSERSFSALRRLKTYLRSTMTQKRISEVAVCHVNKNYCKVVDVRAVAKAFILNSSSSERLHVFGNL
jgi:hypothetical protein